MENAHKPRKFDDSETGFSSMDFHIESTNRIFKVPNFLEKWKEFKIDTKKCYRTKQINVAVIFRILIRTSAYQTIFPPLYRIALPAIQLSKWLLAVYMNTIGR